jgi:hypothetical protein
LTEWAVGLRISCEYSFNFKSNKLRWHTCTDSVAAKHPALMPLFPQRCIEKVKGHKYKHGSHRKKWNNKEVTTKSNQSTTHAFVVGIGEKPTKAQSTHLFWGESQESIRIFKRVNEPGE